jgi:putative adhesin
MRRALLILSLFALPAWTVAGEHSRHHFNCGMCVSIDDMDGDLNDCSRLRVTINNQPAVRSEEMVNVGALRSLVLHAPDNGGIHVVGSDAGGYEVKACKAAAFEDALRDIHVQVSGNEVSADGPDHGQWVVYFLVRAPRNATLDLRSHNGPIALQNVNGTVAARAINGRISVKGSSGTIDIDTENGPISLDGGSGSTTLHAQNGPITVKLRGTSWDGSLDAHTENGPVALKMPSGFRSGVVVESEGHGPVSCHADACREARRTWNDDDNRRIEFGSGSTVVRLSTVNGPVAVHDYE